MGRPPKGQKRTATEEYDSDGGFVANDSDVAPKSKKAKVVADTKAKAKNGSAVGENKESVWEVGDYSIVRP